MDINENFGPELEEYQQQPPVTKNHYRISSPSNENQQKESNSSSSTIRPSNEGNKSYYFRESNEGNQSSTSAIVKPVIDTGEEDKPVKEEKIKVKEESKREH